MPPRLTPSERALRLITERTEATASGCWLWQGYRLPTGYGRMSYRGKLMLAHRVSFEASGGVIPEGKQLGHTCHDEAVRRGECRGGPTCLHRACVNPAHLEPQTRTENMAGAFVNHWWDRSHCSNGHLMDEANTRFGRRDDYTIRQCRACDREKAAKWRAKKKASCLPA